MILKYQFCHMKAMIRHMCMVWCSNNNNCNSSNYESHMTIAPELPFDLTNHVILNPTCHIAFLNLHNPASINSWNNVDSSSHQPFQCWINVDSIKFDCCEGIVATFGALFRVNIFTKIVHLANGQGCEITCRFDMDGKNYNQNFSLNAFLY